MSQTGLINIKKDDTIMVVNGVILNHSFNEDIFICFITGCWSLRLGH